MAPRKVRVSKTIEAANAALKSDKSLSDSAKLVISSLVDMVSALSNSLGLNSSNSSKPPSTDQNRLRKKKITKGQKRKPGGQIGHKGARLEPVAKAGAADTARLLARRQRDPISRWCDSI